jgi:predicted MPP superfamily phosphohydrolase
MNREPVNSKSKTPISRRDFLRLIKFMGLEAMLLAIGGGLYMREYEPSWVEVKEVSLKLPRLAKPFSGLRMAQISDLHFGGWMTKEALTDIVQMVIAQSPDVVVITGDFVMGHNRVPRMFEKLGELADALKALSDRLPTLAVLGNHDYWLDHDAVAKMLRQAGIQELNNSVNTIKLGGERLHIAGVDDVMVRQSRMGVILSQLPDDGCAVLLAHEPDYADLSAETGRFDLQLSGHSHGGQVVLPFIGPPVLPSLARKYPSGLYKVKDMFQYTNRGVGMTPPYVRLNCRPEITIFTLEAV